MWTFLCVILVFTIFKECNGFCQTEEYCCDNFWWLPQCATKVNDEFDRAPAISSGIREEYKNPYHLDVVIFWIIPVSMVLCSSLCIILMYQILYKSNDNSKNMDNQIEYVNKEISDKNDNV